MSDSRFFSAAAEVRHRTVIRNVYMWMTAGLALTAAVAWWTVTTPAVLRFLFGTRFTFFAIIIAEFILVLALSRRIMTMSVPAAVGGFALYSFLNGLTISGVFLTYTGSTIFQAFFTAGGMFGVMSLWAFTTKRDLSGWGHYLFMGLIGLIIAGLVGMFIRGESGESYHLIYSGLGVILFTALTAYDTQMIKRMSDQAGGVGQDDFVRLSIMGALKLYLDFINMFLFLLRLFGRRR